ncbi:MAG: helix-turn-helix domain-containing protein [Alphaproteobacteria bacterium]
MKQKPINKNIKQIEYTLGAKLERHRIKKKWSVEHVAKKICISEKYINAIEQGNLDELPEKPYAIGFIKTYCEILGIKHTPLIAEFKQYTAYNSSYKTKYKSYELENKFNYKKKNLYIIIFILIAITTWILVNALIGVSNNNSNKEYKKINQPQNNSSEIIENNIINDNKVIENKVTKTDYIATNNEIIDNKSNVIENKVTKTDYIATNNEIIDNKSNVIEQQIEKTIIPNNFNNEEEIVTIRPLKKGEIEIEKLNKIKITAINKIKITAIKDTKLTIFKPNGKIHFKGTLRKRKYKLIPINKGYYISANNGGLVAISIKNLYNNKVIGELDIVLKKLVLNSNNLKKHFK